MKNKVNEKSNEMLEQKAIKTAVTDAHVENAKGFPTV